MPLGAKWRAIVRVSYMLLRFAHLVFCESVFSALPFEENIRNSIGGPAAIFIILMSWSRVWCWVPT